MGVGPSTKETSIHHFKDPLLNIVSSDMEVDLAGIIIVGTPQDNYTKLLVGKRVATLVNAMKCQGAILSADGWGNSDIDFANTMEEIGLRGVSVVGMKFIGKQAKFVVENDYTKLVVDLNKSNEGKETEVVGENAANALDAKKALALLKLKMRKDSST